MLRISERDLMKLEPICQKLPDELCLVPSTVFMTPVNIIADFGIGCAGIRRRLC